MKPFLATLILSAHTLCADFTLPPYTPQDPPGTPIIYIEITFPDRQSCTP
jgi:hypothetical protein